MISEIFPLRLRGRGLSIAVLVNFGANALVTFAFSPLKVLNFESLLIFLVKFLFMASFRYMLSSIRKLPKSSKQDMANFFVIVPGKPTVMMAFSFVNSYGEAKFLNNIADLAC